MLTKSILTIVHLHKGKTPIQEIGGKERGGCLLEGGVFSGAYATMKFYATFFYTTLVTMDTVTPPTCTRASLSFCSTSPNCCPSFSQSDCSCPSLDSKSPLDSESSQCSAKDWPFSQQVPNTGARVLYSDFRFCSVYP